jgi:hypothetical protein
MPLSKLEAALTKLRAFRPSSEKVLVRRLTESERMIEHREQEELILLCARFATALEEAGGMAELRRRNSLLLWMTRPGSRLAEYRRGIISYIIQYQRGLPEIYDCEFGSEPEFGFAPIRSLFSPHALENALDDCRKLEQLGWEDGDWGIDLLEEQLWKLKRKAQKYHLWGSHIIMTCYRAHRPELGDRGLLRELHLFLPDLHECVQAVQEAAEDIVDRYSQRNQSPPGTIHATPEQSLSTATTTPTPALERFAAQVSPAGQAETSAGNENRKAPSDLATSPPCDQAQAAQGGGGEDDGPAIAWLTVSQAAKAASTNTGTITRAVDKGELKSNGMRKHQRRIDPADLTRWILVRAGKPERGESDAQVIRIVNKHCKG